MVVFLGTYNDGYWRSLREKDRPKYESEKKRVADAVIADFGKRFPAAKDRDRGRGCGDARYGLPLHGQLAREHGRLAHHAGDGDAGPPLDPARPIGILHGRPVDASGRRPADGTDDRPGSFQADLPGQPDAMAGELSPRIRSIQGGRYAPWNHDDRVLRDRPITAVAVLPLAAKDYSLLSPDKAIEVKVAVGPAVTYAVAFQGKPIIAPSAISMTIDGGRVLGKDAKVRSDKRRSVNEILTPVVAQKASKIPDVFNELTLEFAGDYALIFRAYDDGVAYRFTTSLPGRDHGRLGAGRVRLRRATTSSISPRRRASSPIRSGRSNISP